MAISQRLEELGIELPPVAAPVAAYAPAVVFGSLVRTSGQLPMKDGDLLLTGKCGTVAVTDDLAYAAARQCALNALAAAAAAVGGVDRLVRAVKVVGFVASTEDYFAQPSVINGASDLLQGIFGSRHARSAVGVAALPLNATVEVEVEFEFLPAYAILAARSDALLHRRHNLVDRVLSIPEQHVRVLLEEQRVLHARITRSH